MPPMVKFFQIPKCVNRRLWMLLPFLLLSIPGATIAQDTYHDVVVVGAGSAGLYAAYTLNNLGFDVVVLEATGRRGGRVHDMTQVDGGF